MKITYQICRIAAAVILMQTLFFKFTGAEESGYIFTKVGAEPVGRIGSGIVERIARTFEGFYFGRFDLRCPDETSLRRGEGIRLIELNGVTSEATHIYHPHTPLLHGYRTLIQQWRHAYDIGIANAASGARVTTWREFATILRHHLSRNPTENAPTPQ